LQVRYCSVIELMFALLVGFAFAATYRDKELAALVKNNEVIEDFDGFGIDLSFVELATDDIWDETEWNDA